MHEMWRLLLAEARGMWRFRWYAVGLAWVLAAAAAAVVYSLPNRYEAQARVSIDTQSLLQPLLEGMAVQPDFDTRIRLMTNTLFSRENLETIAREVDLLLTATDAQAQQQVLDSLRDNINLSGSREDDIYTISYTHESPRVAQEVVQTTLDILIDETLRATQSDSASARRFLENQVQEYERRLEDAEERLAEFKRENTGLLPSEGGRGYYDRLSQAEQQLTSLEEELSALQSEKSAIEQEMQRMRQGRDTTRNSPRVQALREQIHDSERRLNDLLLKYTPAHPDVKALEARLQRLRDDLDAALANAEPSDATDLIGNPVYQELQIELNKVEREIATLEPKVAQQKSRIQELKSKVDQITQVEKKLSSLTRDYDVTRKQYEQLLTRLNTAQLSGAAERSGDQVEFRIIDPPMLPLSPAGPPRTMMMMGVLVVSLGAGGGLSFLLHQLRPVFLDVRTLTEVTGRPVLGGVSRVLTNKQRRAIYRESAGFALATGLLVLLVALGALFSAQIAGLVPQL